MQKKLFATSVAAVVLASLAVLPAIASAASPQLFETGTALTTGQKLLNTQTSTFKFVEVGGTGAAVECTESTLTGNLVTNSLGLIEETVQTSSFTSNGGNACTSTFSGSPSFQVDPPAESMKKELCLSSNVEKSGRIQRNACKALPGVVEFLLTNGGGLGNCTYETAEIPFTYPMKTSPLILTVTNAPLKTKGTCNSFYPKEFKLSGTWNWTTDDASKSPLEVK
jgi:hypothetical protein